ncbi:MAG TPA: hypothetical protein VFA81_11585 [Burkholderiales bacterium]|nr:hypothetical protein [Burkholderiales bacterium]
MRAQIEVLGEVFTEWLRIHDLDYDYRIYSADEWVQREGPNNCLRGAELILVFENSLVRFLEDGSGIHDELQDLAEGFGYYFERGELWSIGFYPIENWPSIPNTDRYPELLADPRWKSKRSRILQRSQLRCEDCGANQQLEVHHCYYRFGRLPWQYPDAALLALCRECHQTRAKIELEWCGYMPNLKAAELKLLKRFLEHTLYWYPREQFFAFLAALGEYDDQSKAERFERLLATRSHPEERGAV